MKSFFVYILTSKKNGTLYIGLTSNLKTRIYQHKQSVVKGFTQKYHVHSLVYFEKYDDIQEALKRERRLKKWNRDWKIKLIEKVNPDWKDLYSEL